MPRTRTRAGADDDGGARRVLTLNDVAEILNTSLAQVTALVQREELRAMKLGGRGQWRVAAGDLEDFIERMYAETHEHLEQKRRAGQSIDDEVSEAAQRSDG